jgi:crotonobetainyl-CoA:carnitine CoA-transferase CaiB-like acyl-CoA transferase
VSALKGLTIVETATRVSGEWCAKLLGDFGAEIIKVEPPGGSPTRQYGPFKNGASALFAYCNTNKKSVVLDPSNPGDRAVLDTLLARADALIDDHDEDWCARHGLDPAAVRAAHPHLVHCLITPFGQGAPADRQQAYPINVSNAGGWAWHTPSEAEPSDPPLQGAGRFLPSYDAGLDAAIATAASLWRQRHTGQGQSIDLSEVETQISRADIVIGRVIAGDDEPSVGRRRYDMGGPATSFASADGFIYLYMTTKKHWNGLRALMDWPAWAADFPEDWLEFHCTPDRVEVFRDHFSQWIAKQERVAVTTAAQALGVPIAPVNTAADLAANAQYRHRGFYQTLDHPQLGTLEYPTVPYRMSASPAELTRPAPAQPGQDAAAVLA